jgi:triphosphoribosyl-dephospho-CoA synthase
MTPLGLCAQLACVWEATARKAGNVHRYQDFADTSYLDFLTSAAAIAPVIEQAPTRRVGITVLEAVRATQRVARRNTNLGIILLLAPLATVPPAEPLQTGAAKVLESLDVEDARLVYEAIRLANPGGLGEAPEEDVHQEPTRTLREVMALAAERDLIARQYTDGFALIFAEALPVLTGMTGKGWPLEDAIIACQMHLLVRHPDSLIARKMGVEEANRVRDYVRGMLESGGSPESLDDWLREDGNARNPGTTADLIAATLFAALREGVLSPKQPF